ncbi:chitobiase/beta-hexosaminidase C-terminal domain-containing protein [Leptospira sp. 201903075]|uniref:chitobiase/beta-hexosaminidase C-terminal domain-containing protein n=1 Tax=Leptospira chreensis TaxID=2810035 RepID=UPI001962A21D|nr:chitobiase/beta-hexosaminidase C-terminal domain-containing protein [Leptospira chreensis]MBM9590132.1 chitobiase/beta-hexosaminidase C-terminal domain-containing protein [Leptospira chreensis]
MNRKLSLLLLLGVFSFNCVGFLLPNKEQKDSSFLQSFLGLFWGNPNQVRTVSAEVGPAGGTLQASDGSFSFQIPAGALSDTKVITISREVSPNGSIPAEFGSATPVFKFEPEGLHFFKPASLTVTYNQGNSAEAGIEERSIGMYYIKDDSTLEKMKKVSVDYSSNTIQVEVVHFSFGAGLNIQIWLVSSGIMTNPTSVSNVADRVIDELANYADYGYASVSEYYQANAGVLGPLLNQLVSILGTDPITAAFPNADFDGDGAPNFEDPMVPSLGPVITVSSISFPYISVNSGSNNSTDFTWRSSRTGTYTIRKNASDCNSGSIVFSGNVTANVNQTSASISASSINLGTNALRICVTSAGVTGFGVATITRDDTAPGVTVLPSGGSYGTIQSVALNCSDTGGAGCANVIYTSNGSTPSFGSNCAITNGTLYSSSFATPNQTTTTYKIKSCDHAGNQSIVLSETYTVDTIIPTVTINSVLPSTYLKSGQTATISWKSDKAGNYEVKLGSSCATGTVLTGTNVSGATSANVSITSEIPVASFGSEGTKTVFVCVSNMVGTKGGTSIGLTVDLSNPTISASINSGIYSTPQTLTITCTDLHSGCHEIIYTNNGTSPSFDASGSIVNGQLYTGSIITPNNLVLEYRFLARDHAGNVSSELIRNYTIGQLIPKFTSFEIPEYGAKGVIDEVNKTIHIAVYKAIAPDSTATFTTENAVSIIHPGHSPIPFVSGDPIHLGQNENELVKELILTSPTGTTVNYKIYTFPITVGRYEYILGSSPTSELYIKALFSSNPQVNIVTSQGSAPTTCARLDQYTLNCTFTPISSSNGYFMDVVVTNDAPYHNFTLVKAAKMTVTKNGAGEANGEIPYCLIQHPLSITQPVPGETEMIYARVYYPGLTSRTVENPAVTGQIGIGPIGTDPRTSLQWTYSSAQYNISEFNDNPNNAEYMAKVRTYRGTASYSYVARFSVNGGLNYTYCDTDGSGSDFLLSGDSYPNLEYSVNKLGVINVTNPNPPF